MPTVLILGANGKIGTHAADAFWNKGWTVKRYQRGTDMVHAASEVDVIVNGFNPPNYHNWDKLVPEYTAQVIAAAKASGATVIVPGNVYNFGDTPGEWDETTPQHPCSRKGQIRVDMEAAYRKSGVQTIILRAGNFIDPNHQGDVMSLVYLRSISKGQITAPGGADVIQAFCYLPDWARAAVMLAKQRADLARFEDVPFQGHSFTLNDLKSELETRLRRDLNVTSFPWWIMRATSPFWEMARELWEMRYLWNTPHCLSGAKLARLLPEFHPTDLASVMRAGLPDDLDPDQPVRPGSKPIIAE